MQAKILQIVSGNYYVYLTDSQQTVVAKPLGIFRHDKKEKKPMVGDNVEVNLKDDQYLITQVLDRSCEIKRPKLANLDLVILVISWTQPEFNQLMLDKYLAYYEYYCPQVGIAFSKTDLIVDQKQAQVYQSVFDSYVHDGYLVFDVNKEADLQQLRDDFLGHTICFIGNSGVGKSTLINKLNPEFQLKTQAISMSLNRGKHTTTSSVLLPFLGGFLVDTPGFATLDLDLKPEQLARAYHDFYHYAPLCKFDNCLHTPNAKDCRVLQALSDHQISPTRYQNYLVLLNETKNLKK